MFGARIRLPLQIASFTHRHVHAHSYTRTSMQIITNSRAVPYSAKSSIESFVFKCMYFNSNSDQIDHFAKHSSYLQLHMYIFGCSFMHSFSPHSSILVMFIEYIYYALVLFLLYIGNFCEIPYIVWRRITWNKYLYL